MRKSTKQRNILPLRQFLNRLFNYGIFALIMLIFSLGLGVIGYHYFGKLNWIDSLYNASMILTGMGPVDKMNGNEAKVFASLYALFSGVVFLTTVAIFLSPIAHRMLHILHVDEEDNEED